MDFINKMFRGDRVIWLIFIFLALISIVEVYSASSTLTFGDDTNYWDPIMRHTTFLLAGTLLILVVHAINPRYFSILAVGLLFAIALLIATRIWGKPINGSYRWIQLAPGFRFQPSEIAKLCLIAYTALFLSKRKEGKNDKALSWIYIATAVTCGIILRDNGSMALLLAAIITLMLFVAQVRLDKEIGKLIAGVTTGFLFCILYFFPDEKLQTAFPKALEWKKRFKKGLITFVLFTAFAGCLSGVMYFAMNDEKKNPTGNKDDASYISNEKSGTWKNRVVNFFTEVNILGVENYEVKDKNYQSAHACMAIANGGIFGKLPGNGRERDTLPQAYSDFIYAIIIEETGLIGGIVVILLYLILFIRAGIIANRCDKLFPKFLVMGSAMALVIYALSNMAVAVHLIPVTGQPMPLVSRGGTSTLINCIYIGIILSVSRYENPKGIKREEEIIQELEEEQKIKNEECIKTTPIE
ncbi:MAG: FtsW/RodA/SpoVE family cell cycle protein [Dysgonamonadaceae bacterium]|jgi:cell division protein FtsW|nr:FtsW/RodA/SpoVE family cell cycle protein [Dysgonamonadaceae bacterium]